MKNLTSTLSMNDIDDLQNVIFYVAKKHWISYVFPTLFTLIGLVGIIFVFFGYGYVRLIGIVLMIILYKGLKGLLTVLNTKIYLINEYLTISQGVFGKTITDISIQKLEGIRQFQNVFGKLLGFGTLVVTTGDVSQSYVIRNPSELRSKIINQKKFVS